MDSMPEFLREIFIGGTNPPSSRNDYDVDAFDEAMDECREIFLERRNQYGNHLERSKQYHASALHLKMDRAIKDMENNRQVKRDTLIDFACYALMLLSYKHAGE